MITGSELVNGYNLSMENAKALIDEAELLAKNNRLSRAYTLYQIAIEEIGKCVILYQAILDLYMGHAIDITYLKNKGFFSHEEKSRRSITAELYAIHLVERNGLELDSIKKGLVNDYTRVKRITSTKNSSLYVEIIDEVFSSPKSAVTNEMIEDITNTANIRYESIQPFLQPLDKMQEIANELKKVLNDPIEIKRMDALINL